MISLLLAGLAAPPENKWEPAKFRCELFQPNGEFFSIKAETLGNPAQSINIESLSPRWPSRGGLPLRIPPQDPRDQIFDRRWATIKTNSKSVRFEFDKSYPLDRNLFKLSMSAYPEKYSSNYAAGGRVAAVGFCRNTKVMT